MGIKDYSGTASLNSDVSGVAGTDVSENNDPGTINNALRQIMADLRNDLVIGGSFAWDLISGAELVRVELDAAFDGTTTDFTMTALEDGSPVTVANSTQMIVYVGGARQEPGQHYAASGQTLTFFEAPISSDVAIILASTGEGVAVTEEYLLFEDDSEHMFVIADPNSPDPTQPEEADLGLHLLEPNTP